jgi:hypothetical protein
MQQLESLGAILVPWHGWIQDSPLSLSPHPSISHHLFPPCRLLDKISHSCHKQFPLLHALCLMSSTRKYFVFKTMSSYTLIQYSA